MADKKVRIALENAVEIIYAGGASTISATPEGYIASGRAYNLIGLLEERFPDFELHNTTWGRKQVAYNGLSENIIPADWGQIDEEIVESLDRRPKGVLITYGTDGMEQFLRHLRSVFHKRLLESGQTIIVTGANKDIEEEDTDAWDNLMFALEQAAANEKPGVYLAFHRNLIPANETVKLPYTSGVTQTFVSVNSKRYKKALEDQQATAQAQIKALIEKFGHQPDESIATVYDVNSARLDHQKFIDTVSVHEDTTAIILNLYRCGTANTTKPGKSVIDLVYYMRVLKRVVCFGATENGQPVDLHAYETSVKLLEAGVVPLYNMLREVAIVKLYLLGTKLSRQELISAMLKNEVGEIDESLINQADIAALFELYKD